MKREYKGTPFDGSRYKVVMYNDKLWLVSEGITPDWLFFHDPDTFACTGNPIPASDAKVVIAI